MKKQKPFERNFLLVVGHISCAWNNAEQMFGAVGGGGFFIGWAVD